jgi:hypothetical protein
VEDVPVGQGPEQYMHTTSGGVQGGPPVVLCPGYGAGSAFFSRRVAVVLGSSWGRCFARGTHSSSMLRPASCPAATRTAVAAARKGNQTGHHVASQGVPGSPLLPKPHTRLGG